MVVGQSPGVSGREDQEDTRHKSKYKYPKGEVCQINLKDSKGVRRLLEQREAIRE